MRACLACGESLDGEHFQRKFCDNNDVCRKRYSRGARATVDTPTVEQSDRVKSVAAATLMALSEAGKVHTPEAQALLVLAYRIDNSDRDTGAGLASMVKRLEESLATLLADVEDDLDLIDELKARRDAKRAG